MAIPAIPNGYALQQGNGQAYLSWSIVAGATSYSVQRSTDGVSYSNVATPAVNYYLDTSVTIGTLYYYKVASVNSSGTSSYTNPQSCVPAQTGDLSLGQVRLMAQQRAEMVNSQFVTDPEWNTYINQSYFELYDLLVTTYEDYYLAEPVLIPLNGSATAFDLPNGVNYSGAAPFYKLMGVDLSLNSTDNAYVTLKKFNFIDRNRYVFPNVTSNLLGVFNMQYRVMGDKLRFIPTPAGGQTARVWYIPRLQMLLQDTDIMKGISGWTEYVIIDAAIKALQKEESDVSVLGAQKVMIIERINSAAQSRDAGAPDTISNTRQNDGGYNNGAGWNGPNGAGGY